MRGGGAARRRRRARARDALCSSLHAAARTLRRAARSARLALKNELDSRSVAEVFLRKAIELTERLEDDALFA